jgi:hypothetical protein
VSANFEIAPQPGPSQADAKLRTKRLKCVFRYPVKWIVKVDGVQPFTHNGWLFDFVKENDCISKIIVSVPVQDSDQLPTFSPNPKDSRIIDCALNQPKSTELLMKTLRTLEGFLSVYGLESIALDEGDISWVPETEEEKQRFKEQHFKFKFTKRETSNLTVPFAVIKRSVIAATDALEWAIPLSFYRKGTNDYHDRRYIDAIHDFYFLIETLFGNGKTKNYQVKEELKKSQTLLTTTAEVLKAGEQIILSRGTRTTVLDDFRQKYANKTPEQYLDHIVDLRGFLHHHSLQYKKGWNPNFEYEYELDAILLSYLSFLVCSKKVESLICAPVR